MLTEADKEKIKLSTLLDSNQGPSRYKLDALTN